jgi:hypothetical protein
MPTDIEQSRQEFSHLEYAVAATYAGEVRAVVIARSRSLRLCRSWPVWQFQEYPLAKSAAQPPGSSGALAMPRDPLAITQFGKFLAKSLNLRQVKVRVHWPRWLRLIQRKRRLLTHLKSRPRKPLPDEYFATATLVSFRLEGIQIDPAQVASALAHGQGRKAVRSRSNQRIRNHVAILRHIESAIIQGSALTAQSVVRWYTSISCGLSSAPLDQSTMRRLENIVRRINSPQFRLQSAIKEIAHLHAQLFADPLVPSFNGILSRLLLRYHLGRSGLPPVMFDPQSDEKLLHDEPRLLNRVLEMLNGSYDMMLAQ